MTLRTPGLLAIAAFFAIPACTDAGDDPNFIDPGTASGNQGGGGNGDGTGATSGGGTSGDAGASGDAGTSGDAGASGNAGTGGTGSGGEAGSGGSGGSGGSVDIMCTLTTDDEDCDTCAVAMCNAECLECEDADACAAALECAKDTCFGGDEPDWACALECANDNPTFGFLVSCVRGMCGGFCSF